MPVWTCGGRYCVFLGRRYLQISKNEAASLLGVPKAELRPPFEYRVPLGLVGYPLSLIIGVPVTVLLARRARALRRRAEDAYQESFRTASAHSGERIGSVLLRDPVDDEAHFVDGFSERQPACPMNS
jgi:hypothetical protein